MGVIYFAHQIGLEGSEFYTVLKSPSKTAVMVRVN
jgi:hypothetical protein